MIVFTWISIYYYFNIKRDDKLKKLGKKTLLKVEKIIKEKGRDLEGAIYDYHFNGTSGEKILEELKKYQNNDGGFGHGLEPDFRLIQSSAMATSIGLRHLNILDYNDKGREMIKEGIKYFEETFDRQKKAWFAVPIEVNDFPHTPWWHYDESKQMCVIDEHWGNPSAEIIGYLYKYKDLVSDINVDNLVDYAIIYLNNKKEFESFHEIYCFIRLYEILPLKLSAKIRNKIVEAIKKLVELDKDQWSNQYVAKPLDFISSPKFKFGIDDKIINDNLDYFIDVLENQGYIRPSWGKEFYSDGMEHVWNEWIGELSLKVLLILDKFGRIEK